MGSLQELCYRVICLYPEQTVGFDLDGINQPCLMEVVQRMSMFDLLQYEISLRERGINTGEAILQCQRKIWGKTPDNHMSSVVCPHLLDFCARDGQNWSLSRIFYSKIIRPFVEDLHETDLMRPLFDHDKYFLPILSDETKKQVFCPPNGSKEDFKTRMQSLPDGSLRRLMVLVAQKTLSMTVDLKVCQLFSHHRMKSCMETFYETLQVLSIVLNSSSVLMDFVKTFREQAKTLCKMCVHAIKNSDLQYLDSVLSVCSGVVGYHEIEAGKKSKAALDAMLAADWAQHYYNDEEGSGQDSEKDSEELCAVADLKKTNMDPPGQDNDGVQFASSDDNVVQLASSEDDDESSPNEDDGSVLSDALSADTDFDLMDDAVLFGTVSLSSKWDSTTGMDKVDLKFTNLVAGEHYVCVMHHHLCHWLALTQLHLGVPETTPTIIHGLTTVLKRPQFRSLTLSCAMVSFDDIRHILVTVATSRADHPLERLMFVSLQSKYLKNRVPEDVEDNGDFGESEESFDKVPESLSQYGQFQGSKLVEVYFCNLDVFTGLMLKQFLCQNAALGTLCLTNSFCEAFMTYVTRSLALSDAGQSIHTLILHEMYVEDGDPCMALVALLHKVSPTLSNLSLRGCFVTDHTEKSIDGLIQAISSCKKLKTLDFADNVLETGTESFLENIIKETQLEELSLKDNRLPFTPLLMSLRRLLLAVQRRGTRLKLLDIRGSSIGKKGSEDRELMLSVCREAAEKVLSEYTIEEGCHPVYWPINYQ